MKTILTALVLLASIAGKGQSKTPHSVQRHFLIGVIVTETGRPGVWAGGVDILSDVYPNREYLLNLFSEKFPDIKDVRILSITPMTNAEWKAFWKVSDSSSNKKGGK